MANVAALKKKATEFEQKKQLDKAIASYREILDFYDSGQDENVDVGLYNRVGDLLVRQGNTPDAVTLYERAVDLYTEGGFFNNAIALCNKVLRTSPGRASVYYKLGKISAAKGFKADAKQNFLEYADRMQKSGQMQEAFRALKEFAELCPDQDDIRLMLAEQLTKADKKGEALEQLQMLYSRYDSDGRTTEAQATLDRMRAIDPNVEVKAENTRTRAKADDLVFIDLNAPTPRATRRTRAVKVDDAPPAPPMPTPIPAMEVESTSHAPLADPTPAGGMLGLEPTAFAEAAPLEAVPLEASEFAQIDLSAIQEVGTAPTPPGGERDLALPGELPLIDPSEITVPTPRPSRTLDIATSAAARDALADLPVMDLDGEEPEPIELTVDVPIIDLEPTTLEDEPAPVVPVELELGVLDEIAAAAEADAEPFAPEEADEHFEILEAEAPETPTAFDTIPEETVDEPPPPMRRTSSFLANSVGLLAIRIEDDPENWTLRRQYAEALLDDGNRDEGLKQLEKTMAGLEKQDDLEGARSVADEIIRLNPASVRHHQKRVEYAFRSNDKPRLAEAYIELADALFRDGQADKAKVVYERALEIAPDDMRAKAALESLAPEPAPAPEAPPPAPRASQAATVTKGKRYTGTTASEQVNAASDGQQPAGDDDFVSLGDWLREDEAPKSTRMVVEEEQPTGDEDADFADMLKKFKQGVAENVEEEDHESHYDLGVAYKEMGLIDEAIAQFQKALRGTQRRVRTYEALGQCFLEKKQFPVTSTILQRALSEPGAGDEQLVGVLYLLGYTNEALGKYAEAKQYYERVFAVDIQFRDVGDRLNAVDKAAT